MSKTMTETRKTTNVATKASAATSPAPPGLYGKILQAQQAIDAVPKRGFNAFHKYHYATEADILTVKETLNRLGLVVLPTIAHQETGFKPDGKSWASVTLLFRVVDAETGDAVESSFSGYAEDNFDKAIYKATTGANKYFYLKFFGIATEDDPEREDNVPEKTPYRGNIGTPSYSRPGNAGNPANSSRQRPATESNTALESPVIKSDALLAANKILTLQKQYGLSNDEVLQVGEIESIKTLAESGDIEALDAAYQKLASHVRLQKAL